MTFLNMQVKCAARPLGFDTPYEVDFQALFDDLEQRPSNATLIATALNSRADESEADDMIDAHADESEAVLATMNRKLRKPVLKPFRDANSTVRFARQMTDFWDHDLNDVAGQIDVPILCFTSEYDRIASPEASKWAQRLFPRARLLHAPGATHYFLYDRWDVVAHMIEWFVSGEGHLGVNDGYGTPAEEAGSTETAELLGAEII